MYCSPIKKFWSYASYDILQLLILNNPRSSRIVDRKNHHEANDKTIFGRLECNMRDMKGTAISVCCGRHSHQDSTVHAHSSSPHRK